MTGDPRTSRDLLARAERSLRIAAARGRHRIDIGPFALFVSPVSRDYLMSVALPVARPAEWAQAIDALDAAFRRAGRAPRLEFFRERHPDLEEALDRAGYACESEAAAMALGAGELRDLPRDERAVYERLTAEGGEELDRVLAMQAEAFGAPFDASVGVWRVYMLAGLAEGWIMAGASSVAGEPVSCATLILGDDAAELAGVATAAGHRRRGLAAATCRRLLGSYFAKGHDLAWLSAAETAEGLYEKLGFRRIGTQLNYGRGPGERDASTDSGTGERCASTDEGGGARDSSTDAGTDGPQG